MRKTTSFGLLLSLVVFIGPGCVILGNQWVHSPSAEGGLAVRSRHVHGGVTKKSPPDNLFIIAEGDSSILMSVSAKTLSEKRKWGGPGLPFIPLFFIKRYDHYENNPDELEVLLMFQTQTEISVFTEDMTLVVNNQIFKPIRIKFEEQTMSPIKIGPFDSHLAREGPNWSYSGILTLVYQVPAHETPRFQFIPNGVVVGDQKQRFPKVHFIKVKQNWALVGP